LLRASARRLVPAAVQVQGDTLGLRSDHSAVRAAGTRVRIPHALHVVVASRGSVIQVLALHRASARRAVPAAHGVGLAECAGGLTVAVTVAGTLGRSDLLPDALIVRITLRRVDVTVRALLTAEAVAPHASGGGIASDHAGELVAVAVADAACPIPLALEVGIARLLGVIVQVALDDALIDALLAHRVGNAARRVHLQVAVRAAGAGRGVPHATPVEVARLLGRVHGFALLPAIVTAVGRVEVAVGDVFSTDGSCGDVLADTAAGRRGAVPLADRVRKTLGLGAEHHAVGAAGSGHAAPHTFGIGIASRLGGVLSERADLLARQVVVGVPAAVALSGAGRLAVQIHACHCADLQGSVPHASVIGIARGLICVADTAPLLALVASRGGRFPLAERVLLAVVAGLCAVEVLHLIEGTVLHALNAGGVPLAATVGCASSLAGITHVAVVAHGEAVASGWGL